MKFRLFKSYTEKDVEDVVAILRIICGGSVIATLFQGQIHGIIIAGFTYCFVRSLRSSRGE